MIGKMNFQSKKFNKTIMKKSKILIIFVFLFLNFNLHFFAQEIDKVMPAKIFQSHMVLQQNEPLKIWGTATVGKEIEVFLGGDKLKTITDVNGKWEVVFPKRKASFNPITLKIDNIILKDILIGEVWICSGQSNMVRPLKQVDGGMLAYESSNKNAIRILHNKHPRLVAPPEGFSKKDLQRSNTDDFFEGIWETTTDRNIADFSAVGWYFGHLISQKKDVPVGLILIAVGGSAINNWISPKTLKETPLTSTYFTKDWLENEDVDRGHRKRGKDAFQNVIELNQPYLVGKTKYRWMCEPGFLFEAGIADLQNLRFKGILWYQGETDAITDDLVERYKILFPLMVKDWRTFFNQGNFPFIYVQLPRFKHTTWPEFRNIQRLANNEIDNSFMVTTIDLGEENDVHPTDKLPIGKRAADLALTNVYKYKINGTALDVKKIYQVKTGIKIVLTEKIQLNGNPNKIPGFEIADDSGNYSKVNAILNNNKIILIESDKKIIMVRYGWESYPKPDLTIFSENGSPLTPFKINLSN